jgi:hypothetical protein
LAEGCNGRFLCRLLGELPAEVFESGCQDEWAGAALEEVNRCFEVGQVGIR